MDVLGRSGWRPVLDDLLGNEVAQCGRTRRALAKRFPSPTLPIRTISDRSSKMIDPFHSSDPPSPDPKTYAPIFVVQISKKLRPSNDHENKDSPAEELQPSA